TSVPAIDIITRSGYCSARRSSTAGTVNRSTPKSEGPKGPPIRPPSGFGGSGVWLTVGGVPKVVGRGLHTRVEALRPTAQGRIVMRLFGRQVGLLQVFHVLPGEEVLFDDLLLQRQEFGGAAGGHVAGVAGLADRSLGVEVVGVVLVDRCLPGDLDGGH